MEIEANPTFEDSFYHIQHQRFAKPSRSAHKHLGESLVEHIIDVLRAIDVKL